MVILANSISQIYSSIIKGGYRMLGVHSHSVMSDGGFVCFLQEQLILDSLEHDREHKRARQTEETEMRRRMDEMEQEEIDKQRQIEKERAAAGK